MSEEQLEMVRETVRLVNANDLDGMRPLLHPEIAMWGPTGWPESGPMREPDDVLRQFERLGEDYEERHSEIVELTRAGEWAVGGLLWHTRGRASGIESTAELWFASRFRKGRIVEIRWFWKRDDALAAAGAEGA